MSKQQGAEVVGVIIGAGLMIVVAVAVLLALVAAASALAGAGAVFGAGVALRNYGQALLANVGFERPTP